MGKWLKFAFLAVLLIGAGYFFGKICGQVGQAYELILSPSRELLAMLFWLLLAMGAVLVSAGLVAALLRPVWVGIIAFVFSGLAMLLGWQVTAGNTVLVLLYILAAAVYAVSVARELEQRVRFSIRPISEGQNGLLAALVIVVCGSLCLGYAAHIEREGFSMPESYIEMFMEQIEEQIVAQMPVEQREEAVAQFSEMFRRGVDEFFERMVKPYEQFIPLAVAITLYMPLVTITRLLVWVPTTVSRYVLRWLTVLGVTKVVTETREVQRLILVE
jgi:hypothetical protein